MDNRFKSGLPRPAADFAANRGETLIHNETLLIVRENRERYNLDPEPVRNQIIAAREGSRTVDVDLVDVLVNEIIRLQEIETDYLKLLGETATLETVRYDHLVKYPLIKLDDDYYLAWSPSSDAPCSWRLTSDQIRERGWTEHRIQEAREPDTEGILWNRAGPREKTLTVEAMKEAYETSESYKNFVLTPSKVQCATTQDMKQNDKGEWVNGEVYWSPWNPTEVPEKLPENWETTF